jgi:hypothetical protein
MDLRSSKFSVRRPALSLLLSLVFAAALSAATLPTAKPSDVGLSADRLGRLSRVMEE